MRLYREEKSYEVDFEGVNEGELTSLWMRKAHKRNKHADTAVVKNGSLGNFSPILRHGSSRSANEPRHRDRNIEKRKEQHRRIRHRPPAEIDEDLRKCYFVRVFVVRLSNAHAQKSPYDIKTVIVHDTA